MATIDQYENMGEFSTYVGPSFKNDVPSEQEWQKFLDHIKIDMGKDFANL
ncbi:MAG: hypothetical protein P8H03_06765 [Emcibacteraceae bacterium]|nr:hypothetical protein [Emcibacteraceae bacterium]